MFEYVLLGTNISLGCVVVYLLNKNKETSNNLFEDTWMLLSKKTENIISQEEVE